MNQLLFFWVLKWTGYLFAFSAQSVQLLSRPNFLTSWAAACQTSLSITNSQSLLTNSFPLSWWCHPTISSSIIPFSSCHQSFPASGSFPMNQFFTSDGQSIGVSGSTSVLSMNIQDWFPLGYTSWISLQSKGLSFESPPTPQFKSINSSALSFLHSAILTSIHDHWKNNSLD